MTTIQKAERRARQRVDTEHHRDDMRVMRWKDWYLSKGISKATAARLRKNGKGPRTVWVSERALGVTAAADREWTLSRTSGNGE
jgi:hypothetical protein